MSEAEPSLQELIRRAVDSRLRSVNVAMPGIVVDYDAAKKTATVLPALRGTIPDDDGVFQPEDLPPIPNVKVVWPKCGKISITGTLQPGDTVELVFQTRATTEWRRTGKVSTPVDERYHGLGYPVAFPGYDSDIADELDIDDSIGRPGGLRLHFTDTSLNVGTGSDFVAMAAKVAADLNTLKAAISTATVVAGDGGAAFKANIMASLGSFPASVASTNLKAD